MLSNVTGKKKQCCQELHTGKVEERKYIVLLVPRALLTSLTLLLKRGQGRLLLSCLLQHTSQTNLRYFASAILQILHVPLPIALNFC